MIRSEEIDRAVAILRRGGIVALPTETVYGLGGDATNAAAVEKIFQAKGRPPTNPLIIHVASAEIARRFVANWPDHAKRLTEAFWPGPLTLVLPKAALIVPQATAGLQTVAVRCPDHEVCLEVLKRFGGAVAAPSANRSNHLSPTTARHVREDMGERVEMILDGGPCRVGIESTVLDLTAEPPRILRPGAIGPGELSRVIGKVRIAEAPLETSQPAMSPGQHPVHYAPRAPAFRFGEEDAEASRRAAVSSGAGVVFLVRRGSIWLSRIESWGNSSGVIEMPPSADEYARRLYAALHEADDRRPHSIWIEEVPEERQWDAVRDRIARATKKP